MLLHIVARGRIGRSAEAELVDRYLVRVAWPTRVTELPDRGGKTPPLPAGTKIVLLDEKGKNLSSTAFADQLGDGIDGPLRPLQVDAVQHREGDVLLDHADAAPRR